MTLLLSHTVLELGTLITNRRLATAFDLNNELPGLFPFSVYHRHNQDASIVGSVSLELNTSIIRWVVNKDLREIRYDIT
jgi:hypothetical protein